LFTHEKQLNEELEKLKVQLTLAEQTEKEISQTGKDDTRDSLTNAALPNGHIDGKEKVVNGDISHDGDSTAVNTPIGSSTPLPKVSEGQTDDAPPTANSLRLQTLHLEKLLNFLQKDFAATRQKLSDLLVNNEIKFTLLWCLFRLGSVITFKDYESGLTMAGEVFSARKSLIVDYQCRVYAQRRRFSGIL
jgi:hypothetical protein